MVSSFSCKKYNLSYDEDSYEEAITSEPSPRLASSGKKVYPHWVDEALELGG